MSKLTTEQDFSHIIGYVPDFCKECGESISYEANKSFCSQVCTDTYLDKQYYERFKRRDMR